jgi:glucose/arabinose dehydrogenase
VLRADGGTPPKKYVFASGLRYPFGIAFYPPGPDPQWVYVGDTGAVVRFPYRSGDLSPRGEPETVVPRLPVGGHATRDVVFSPDGATMYVSVVVINESTVWGRPVGVAVDKGGALLISEDASGTIWRVSYTGRSASTR